MSQMKLVFSTSEAQTSLNKQPASEGWRKHYRWTMQMEFKKAENENLTPVSDRCYVFK